MRYHRVRFTKTKLAKTVRRTEDGTRFRNSSAGRSAKREALGEQRRRQESLCADCNQFMALGDSKFKHKLFTDGAVNPVIHRVCPA